MLHSKKWILSTLLAILITISSIIGFNFFMDPLWTFNNEHKFNQYQKGGRERQQKSDALYFRNHKYDTLIFGSSRTAFLNQHKFNDSTFNYSSSDMQPNEYIHYLDFAINKAKQPIKTVYIGLDFFGALSYQPTASTKYKSILEEIEKPFYRYKLLSSLDTIDYATKNFKYYFKKSYMKYTYNYVKTSRPIAKHTLQDYNKAIQGDIDLFTRDRYKYPYDESYKDIIFKLVSKYKNIKFIAYTTPVSEKHFKNIIHNDLYETYEKWLQDSVSVFGEVSHFMYVNEMATNAHLYFMDSHHGYAETYECITSDLLKRQSRCPKIMMLINKNNLDEKLTLLEDLNH
ncbi:MAG: hypothetical protein ACI9TV_002620 [Sulfurimonas sp.]|jgi:hypothetical protein|uniref:hypothetical protein n=1 Tax=Sulfurimonas sp. TaxID=2022749 RepID=UPI0039E26C87